MTERVEGAPDPEVRAYRPPRRYTAAYKQRILEEYERLDKEGKGALLRREGLYNQLISVWRKQRDRGAVEALERPVGRPKSDPRDRELTRLRADIQRLETELATARTVIEVQGKALLTFLWVPFHDRPGSGGQRPPRVRSAMAISASGLW